MKKIMMQIGLRLMVAVVLLTLFACSSYSAPTPTPAPAPKPTSTSASSGTSAKSVSIDLVAKGVKFDKSSITVPAGAQVTINFDNQDAGIPHNFAAYTNSAATTSIFVGQIITGPAKATYTFTAPSAPGTYFFRCDIHPAAMIGSLVVQ